MKVAMVVVAVGDVIILVGAVVAASATVSARARLGLGAATPATTAATIGPWWRGRGG